MCFQFKMQILISLICLLIYLPNIKSNCLIKYNSEHEIVPKFQKSVGKLRIRVPIRGGNTTNALRIYNGESVDGFCETYFSPIMYTVTEEIYNSNLWASSYEIVAKFTSNQTNIVLNCRDGKLFFNKNKLEEQNFSCAANNWSFYSTRRPYIWCHKNQNSSTFLFATENLRNKYHILAAVCYNIYQLSVQTFVYNKTNLQSFNFDQPAGINKVDNTSNDILDEKLWNLETTITSELSNDVLQEKINQMAKTEEWLYLANYEVSCILQDELLTKYFKGYESILNVIWWRPLRLGNWKQFQNTLTNYVQSNNSYELYVGTSGIAKYPSVNKCYKEKYLEIHFGSQNETVPAYIWTYLKSNDQLNRDFIIVGYNAPYAEYFTTEKIIFCPDICEEIPWLKEISSTFHYAYGGIMFCCSTDFIKQTQYLQGFPFDVLPLEDIATTVVMKDLDDFTTKLYVD